RLRVGALRQQPARELAGVDIETPYHPIDLPNGTEPRIDKILARAESRWLKRVVRLESGRAGRSCEVNGWGTATVAVTSREAPLSFFTARWWRGPPSHGLAQPDNGACGPGFRFTEGTEV